MRTLKQRDVTYTCQFPYCEHPPNTQLRYPGPTPRHCAFHKQQMEQRRRQDDREAAERMRRLREQRRTTGYQPE
jgi:hypothetical protein